MLGEKTQGAPFVIDPGETAEVDMRRPRDCSADEQFRRANFPDMIGSRRAGAVKRVPANHAARRRIAMKISAPRTSGLRFISGIDRAHVLSE
jgi:hypothetical protein